MAIINPWVEVFASTTDAGQSTVNLGWQANKEYLVWFTDNRGNTEIVVGHIRIPFDIPAPSSGVAGMRAACGDNIAIAAEVFSNGYKQFRPVWGDGNVTDVIYRILERDISPDAGTWSLDPSDNTHQMTEWLVGNNSRSKTISDFSQDYEYLFIFTAPESSSQQYYACSTFHNFSSFYKTYSGNITDRGFLYWYHKTYAKLSGRTTSGTLTLHNSSNTHGLFKIYRRPCVYDTSLGFYNCFPLDASYPKKKGSFTRFMDYDTDYIIGGLDHDGDNELVTGTQRYIEAIEDWVTGDVNQGFITRLFNGARVMFSPRSNQFKCSELELLNIHTRAEIEEYQEVVPDPDPEPEPDVIDCEDQCLTPGDKYVTEVSVEVIFNDPPDWSQRSYAYQWKAPSKELKVSSTEQDGRVAIFKLEHTMEIGDEDALVPYDISVLVKDLQYTAAGVEDSDSAVLTFEYPCLILDNETNFSINDVSVVECGPSDSNTTAVFTVTSDVAIQGSDVTIDYATSGIEATSGSDFTAKSGTLTFSEGDTTKTISIVIDCDDVPEYDETFKVTLSNLSRGTITDNTGIGTIVDDSPNEIIVELADEGSQYQNFILRDISGSMTTSDVTLDGATSTRETVAIAILNNYNIPSADIVCASGANVTTFATLIRRHVLDNVSASQKNVSVFFVTDSTDGYGTSSSNFSTYTSPSNDHPEQTQHGVVPNQTSTTLSPDVVVAEGDTWADVMGVFPSTIEDMKITVVRLVGQSASETANSIAAVQGYNDLFTQRPTQVSEASLETFDDYTPGEPGPLNDRIDASVLSTYNAYCSKDPGNTIQIQASDEASARQQAEQQLTCTN